MKIQHKRYNEALELIEYLSNELSELKGKKPKKSKKKVLKHHQILLIITTLLSIIEKYKN